MSEADSFAQLKRSLPIQERVTAAVEFLNSSASDEALKRALAACLELCSDGKVQQHDLKLLVSKVLCLWAKVFQRAESMQGLAHKLEWKMDEDYSEARHMAGLLLDLMGYLPIQQVESALREGLSLADQRLKMFAALSLLRQLQPVDPDELEKTAASHEVRILLWEQLRLQNMDWLMPKAWSGREMLAASELSRWVAHPMELGIPPEEIELMGIFPETTDAGLADVFLFRFREYPKPWEPGEGWKAGIAGWYREGNAIGSCWSAFENWHSRSPEEHFRKLQGNIF